MRKLVVLVSIALAATSVTLAEREVDETRPAAANGEVSIELIAGKIRVIGWDRNEVKVTGVLGDEVEELEIDSDDGDTSIEVAPREGEHEEFEATTELEIHVPSGSELEVEAVAAPISVEGLTGTVSIEAVAGEVDIEGGMGELEVETVSSVVTVRSAAPLRDAEFESVSGSITVDAALDPEGDFSFETVSGNIELRLPAGTSAEFEVSTFSGGIENEFGPAAEKTSEYLPSKSLSFSIGSGRAQVSVSSFSGHIKLVKK